jgi:hypothetical protein
MAPRKPRFARGSKPVVEDPDDDEEDIIDAEEAEDEMDDEIDDVDDDEDEDEDDEPVRKPVKAAKPAPVAAAPVKKVAPAPAPVAKKAAKPAPVVVEDDEEDEEPVKPVKKVAAAPAPKTEKKVAPAAAPVKKVAPVVEADEDEEEEKAPVRKTSTKVGMNPIADFMEMLEVGQSIIITRDSDLTWRVSSGTMTKAPSGKIMGRQGKAYWEEVANPAFTDWQREWGQKTFAEKKAEAKKLGVTYEAHDNPKIEVMRITEAVREKIGIQKYKPEYASRAARAAIKS